MEEKTEVKQGYVEYDSNNSGGNWWLTDKNWRDLEKAEWVVDWYANRKEDGPWSYPGGRFLGALASSAKRYGLKLPEAVSEWERITGATSTDAGCPCCGKPHSFTEYDAKGNYVTEGPEICYEARW